MARLISGLSENRLGVRTGERYGIEVEAEGLGLAAARERVWPAEVLKYWTYTEDGSLRNGGIEFVSTPLARSSVPPAIAALWPFIEHGDLRPSVRTGVHIHCSCLGLNTDQLLRILQVYALVEPVLFAYVGADREENIYCIPWYRAHDEPRTIASWLSPMRGGEMVRTRQPCKYSALYIGPISTFGTIEFRHAPTWDTGEQMLNWFKLVQCVMRAGDRYPDPLAEWHRLGPVEFANKVFPFPWAPKVDERVYEEVDVEYTANLLIPERREDVHPMWGKAPELNARGQVYTGRAVVPPPAQAGDTIRVRETRVPPELTVNAGTNQQYYAQLLATYEATYANEATFANSPVPTPAEVWMDEEPGLYPDTDDEDEDDEPSYYDENDEEIV